ncbi:MAG: hypothetical protein Q4F49_01290 [Pseudoxanthomonas suwonensis]|nr:hypothetical protein [Pseudoxanthomonas suwonensis]
MHSPPSTPGHPRDARLSRARLRVAIIVTAAVVLVLLAWHWGVNALTARVSADLDRTLQELPAGADAANLITSD